MRIIAGDREHAAICANAMEVRVMKGVGGAIYAWRLAKPHAEHAIMLAPGNLVEELSAKKRGRGEFFIEAGDVLDIILRQQRFVSLHLEIDAADG